MIWIFIRACLCESISINTTNYELYVNEIGIPLILEMRDPYCSHCKAFRPTWDKLANESRFAKRVTFGDIDCLENKKLCRSLDVNSYPTVLYIDRESRVEYDGIMSFESIETFIEKQLSFPVKMIETDTDLQQIIEVTNQSSVFYIEFQSTDDEKFQTLQNAASSVRNRTCIFIGKFSSSETKLSVFRATDYQLSYDGDWSNESVDAFVQTNMFCLLPPLTSQIFDEFARSDELMFLVFCEPHQYNRLYNLVRGLNASHQVFYQVWEKKDYLSRYIGISKHMLPQFVLLDTNRSRWSLVSEDITMFDHSKVKWRGPGDGPLREMWEALYSVRAAGGAAMIVLTICVCVFIAIVIVIIYQCYEMYQEERRIEKNE